MKRQNSEGGRLKSVVGNRKLGFRLPPSILRPSNSTIGLTTVTLLFALSSNCMAELESNASKFLPPSCSEALEQASDALADGRFADAAQELEQLAANTAAPPFVRGIALFGLARTAWEQEDAPRAIGALRQLTSEVGLPAAHRETALRWINEIERQHKGLPARDPTVYRTKLPVLGRSAAVFHVAATGDSSGDGTEAKPFASLRHARDAIRSLKRSRGGTLPEGGVRVVVHGGEYPVSETLDLKEEDSGTPDAPVVFQAKSGETPIFTGGVRIRHWKPVADQEVRDEFEPSVRDRIVEADVRGPGVNDLGDATALRQCPELFCDGVPQTLARWPNRWFIQTGEVLGTDLIQDGAKIDGCRDGKFHYEEERPARWVNEPDVRLHGYWFWDWHDDYQKVAAIEPETRTITIATPYATYGYRKGQRFYALNVRREIDQPGEWYVDRQALKLYWLPPEQTDPGRAAVEMGCFSRPFITITNAENIILQGLVFQEGRGDAVHIRGGADCLVAGCTVRQFGGDAVVIEGGIHHGVFGSVIQRMGCGGIQAKGGDRETLTPGCHFVENCIVSDISRLQRTYAPAVLLDGCGNRIAHNLFERMPSSALRIEGNDHVIELNLIRHVVQESDDQGGLDMFGNPLYRGIVVRWNHWSDIAGGTRCGAAGVRLDDMICGAAVYGNIFERCGSVIFGGVQIHGGKENLVDGNLFLDCYAGVSFAWWGEQRWLERIKNFLPQAAAPPYAERYPDLARIKQNADMNFICRNVFSGCESLIIHEAGHQQMALNFVTSKAITPMDLSDERALSKDPQLRRLLMEAIPIGEIGPYAHPWCAPVTAADE